MAALASLAGLALAGCNMDAEPTASVASTDYHRAHPIVLAHAPTSLDIFPVGAGVDVVNAGDLRAFADRYRRFGSGSILIMQPAGHSAQVARTVTMIRRALAADGVRGNVNIGSYAPSSEAAASPIRLTFVGLKAGVRSPCGRWPTDLASGGSLETWQNAAYPNFGCATQAMLAAQVDDPRDFVEARGLDDSDVEMRLRAINHVRQGSAPDTSWATSVTSPGG
jgi:pilus assembly protein CpaD